MWIKLLAEAGIAIFIWLIDLFFGDAIKAKITQIVGGITAVTASVLAMVFPSDPSCSSANEWEQLWCELPNKVSKNDLEAFLQAKDGTKRVKPYQGRHQANEMGVQFDYNFDNKYDWALSYDCEVWSYNGKVKGRWAVGEYVWVVVFPHKDHRVAFSKASLPKSLKNKANCQ